MASPMSPTWVADAKAAHQTTLAGAKAFQLHYTYGFPIDLTLEMAAEAGVSVDEAAFRDGNLVWGRVVADIPDFNRELVAALAEAPERATPSHFVLPASIELARALHDAEIPDALIDGYVTALARLPLLAGLVATPDWNETLCAAALAATAASTGQHALAELLLEADDVQSVLAYLRTA